MPGGPAPVGQSPHELSLWDTAWLLVQAALEGATHSVADISRVLKERASAQPQPQPLGSQQQQPQQPQYPILPPSIPAAEALHLAEGLQALCACSQFTRQALGAQGMSPV